MHDVGVLGHRLGRGLGLGEVDVVELGHREAGEPDVGDVHEGVEARARLADDGAAEGGEVVGARVARRDQRRRALEGDQLVGGNADGRAVGEDVGVQVDEARRHELAGGVEHALSALSAGMSASSASISAEADADIALGPEVLAGIEHLAALDHAGRTCRSGPWPRAPALRQARSPRARGRKPTGKRQELAARGREHGRFLPKLFCIACARACTRPQGTVKATLVAAEAAQASGSLSGWRARYRPAMVGGERIELPTSSV